MKLREEVPPTPEEERRTPTWRRAPTASERRGGAVGSMRRGLRAPPSF